MAGNLQVAFAVAVFLISYGIIVSEKIHRTIMALVGAAVMIVCGVVSQEIAVHSIDFNALGLLIGMMLIVGLTKDSGIFECAAVAVAKLSKGHPVAILVSLSALTAVLSPFIDSVTVILLVIPVTISIARILEVDPLPMVFSEIMLCNIGGAATLIGDPPNLLIGTAAGFGFTDFLRHMAPPAIVLSIVALLVLWLVFRKSLHAEPELREHLIAMDPMDEIKDKSLAIKSLVVMVLVVIGFLVHQLLHMESATIALAGAALLLLVVRPDPEHALHKVEWAVIFFFVGLFVLVGGLEAVGVIEWLAEKAIELTGSDLTATGLVLLWVSSIGGAFLDNIPLTATLVPIVQHIGVIGSFPNMDPLWVCLALGACLGGNGTAIAASANVVAIGMLDEEGVHFSFLRFMKMGFPLMLLTVILASVYVCAFYLS